MMFSLYRAWGAGRVVTYTVHEHEDAPADRVDRAEELVFIKDGFNFSAALFAPVWLLANALWIEFGIYALAVTSVSLLADVVGFGGFWAGFAIAVIHLLVGAEADSLKRFALERRGWHAVGTVVGNNSAECERRFFDTWLDDQPLMRIGDAASRESGHYPNVGFGGAAPAVNAGGGGSASSSLAGSASQAAGAQGGAKTAVPEASRGRRWWPFSGA